MLLGLHEVWQAFYIVTPVPVEQLQGKVDALYKVICKTYCAQQLTLLGYQGNVTTPPAFLGDDDALVVPYLTTDALTTADGGGSRTARPRKNIQRGGK